MRYENRKIGLKIIKKLKSKNSLIKIKIVMMKIKIKDKKVKEILN